MLEKTTRELQSAGLPTRDVLLNARLEFQADAGEELTTTVSGFAPAMGNRLKIYTHAPELGNAPLRHFLFEPNESGKKCWCAVVQLAGNWEKVPGELKIVHNRP